MLFIILYINIFEKKKKNKNKKKISIYIEMSSM